MKLEYSPSCDKFYRNGVVVTLDEAKSIYKSDQMELLRMARSQLSMSGMNKVIEFNWDMKRVHDYYGNGYEKV